MARFPSHWLSMALDLGRALVELPAVEWRRRHLGPAPAVQWARRRGEARRHRSGRARLRLRHTVRLIDRVVPGGPNCYRRALLEMVLDGGAARERLLMGLRSGGGVGSGHAWLESDTSRDLDPRPYDASFVL